MISGQRETCSDAIVCRELYEILLTGRLAVVTMSGVDLTFHKTCAQHDRVNFSEEEESGI